MIPHTAPDWTARAKEIAEVWREMFEEHGKPLPFQHFLDLSEVAVAKLNEQGIETVLIPSTRSFDYPFLNKFMAEAKRFEADLIHSHLPGANLYSSVAGRLTGRPSVLTYHGELFLPGSPTRYAGIKNLLVRKCASKIVMVADYLKNDFVKIAKFPEAKLTTVYNGIPLNDPDPDFDQTARRADIAWGVDGWVFSLGVGQAF